jgi:diacylglycerol kinase
MGNFLKSRIDSFSHAFNGLFFMIRNEKNSWIHLFITIIVIVAGVYFNISRIEWSIVILTIALVWAAELINTSLEKTVDLITIEKNTSAKLAKDFAAAAVLCSAFLAVIIGLIIFIPYL